MYITLIELQLEFYCYLLNDIFFTAPVTGLKQTSATENSVTIEWDPIPSCPIISEFKVIDDKDEELGKADGQETTITFNIKTVCSETNVRVIAVFGSLESFPSSPLSVTPSK